MLSPENRAFFIRALVLCELVYGVFDFVPLLEVSELEFVFSFPLSISELPHVHRY